MGTTSVSARSLLDRPERYVRFGSKADICIAIDHVPIIQKADTIACDQLGEVGSMFLLVAPRCASRPPINEDKIPGSSSR